VVTYSYDSWGNPLGMGGSLASTVGALNPFRYKGYYYDTETSMYYLQSRYYNPELGRFISKDDPSNSQGANCIDDNLYALYAYCNNNPIVATDSNGDDAIFITDSNSVKILGHSALFLQDSGGNWWYVMCGTAKLALYGDLLVQIAIMPKNINIKDIKAINIWIAGNPAHWENGVYYGPNNKDHKLLGAIDTPKPRRDMIIMYI
jgi:RHS repeat-associated protein